MIKVISHITLHCKAYSLCTELCLMVFILLKKLSSLLVCDNPRFGTLSNRVRQQAHFLSLKYVNDAMIYNIIIL